LRHHDAQLRDQLGEHPHHVRVGQDLQQGTNSCRLSRLHLLLALRPAQVLALALEQGL
jgi:hypothetical protein